MKNKIAKPMGYKGGNDENLIELRNIMKKFSNGQIIEQADKDDQKLTEDNLIQK